MTLSNLTISGVDADIMASAIADAKARQDSRNLTKQILESDEAFAEFMGKTSFRREPCVRQGTYGGREVPIYCHWHGFPFEDPRSPVVMLGSRYSLIRRFSRSTHACANGWAYEVFLRYMRRSKFTSMDRREISKFLYDMRFRLYRKFPLSYHFGNHVSHLVKDHWWIDGEPFFQQGPISEKMMRLLMQVYKKLGRLSEKALRYAEKASGEEVESEK